MILGFAACEGSGSPDSRAGPRLSTLTPAVVSARAPAEATLRGEHLSDDVRVTLDSTRASTSQRAWRVRLDPGAVEIDQVQHVDTETLRFTIPAGLAYGSYSVTALSPAGETATLAAALLVTEDAAALTLSIESAPAAEGEPIGERTLTAGDSLDLYAVFRTEQGDYVRSDVAVMWAVTGPAELQALAGSSTQLLTASVGTAVVRADYGTSASAQTGELHIVAAEPTSISIEDAPSGMGRAVSGPTSLTTDDTLDLYAVARDRFGNFVMDVAVGWSSSSPIANLPEAPSNHVKLEFTQPGTTELTASHDAYAAAQPVSVQVAAGRARELQIVPDHASLVSGGPALQFGVEARDAHGNLTLDTGALSWDLAQGTFTNLDAGTGLLSPTRAGQGAIVVHSTYGLDAVSGAVEVLPGAPERLMFVNPPLQLMAGGPPVALQVQGMDAAGNIVADAGALSWSIVSGSFGELDTSTGVLTPKTAGTASVRAASASGPSVESPVITIAAGPAVTLTIVPDSANLSTDDAPLQFGVSGLDAYGNAATQLGTITWSLASGSLGQLDAVSGVLDPKVVGTASVRAQSSLGPNAQTGNIQVVAGRAATLAIAPKTVHAMVGDPPVTFAVTALDADGNATLDLGTLSYTLNTGAITTLDASAGTFSPDSVGTGTVRVTSSHGAYADSSIDVAAFAPRVSLSALRAPGWMWQGERNARIEVDITNDGTREAQLTGLWFGMRYFSDVTPQYTWRGDYQNPTRIAAKSGATLVYYLDAAASASTGTIEVTANLEAFHPLFGPSQAAKTSSMTMWSSTGPNVTISAPVAPANRICAGGSVSFANTNSGSIAPSFNWRFPGASPSTSTQSAPSASYAQLGNFPYSVRITDLVNLNNTTLSSAPIFVGATGSDPTQAYPTGSLQFSAPAGDPAVDMASLPNAAAIAMTQDLSQCDGTPLPTQGQRYVTLFVDRGKLDPSRDIRPDLPGIQVALSAGQGRFDPVALDNGPERIEGTAMVYGEFFHEGLERVTAAGSAAFHLTNDTSAPSVTGSLPENDCESSCFTKGKPWVFRFSEPINTASLSNLRVERLIGNCASGVFLNLSSSSSYTYDAASRTLLVYPATQLSSTFNLRVTLGSQLTDTAATPNALTPMSRCANVTPAATSPAPDAPSLSDSGPSPFSPDGDGSDETTSWNIDVDAATRYVQLRVSRGPVGIWGSTAFTNGSNGTVISWDGRDSSGRVVQDGFYRYDIKAYNADSVASAAVSGAVEVDSAIHYIGIPRRN